MITVNSIPERREAVTAINDYDARTGGLKSQKAKYEKPTWFYILAILNGKSRSWGHSIDCIQKELARNDIHIDYQSIRRFLIVMMNLDYSIHPHRRNCGISCYEAVNLLGGVQVDIMSAKTGGAPADIYYLGKSQALVDYHRRAWNIKIS